MTESEFDDRMEVYRNNREVYERRHDEQQASFWQGRIIELTSLRPLLVSAEQSDDHAAEGEAL